MKRVEFLPLVPNYDHVEIKERKMNRSEGRIFKFQEQCIEQYFPNVKPRYVHFMSRNARRVNAIAGEFLKINRDTYKNYSRKDFRELIVHELIHYYLGDNCLDHGHNDYFKAIATSIGLKGSGEHNWKYKFECQRCKRWIKSFDNYNKASATVLTFCQCNNPRITKMKYSYKLDMDKLKAKAMDGTKTTRGYRDRFGKPKPDMVGDVKKVPVESLK